MKTTWIAVATLLLVAGCHSDKKPQATAQDLDAARDEAQRAVQQARAEASKDIKSAAKTGSDPRSVALAKATGSYDVAMVKADGDHKVATEKCLTLEASAQQPCKDHADADYETAKAAAKATRMARQQ